MKTSTLAVIIVIILAIIGLGWWWYAQAPTATPVAGTQEEGTSQVNDTPDAGIGANVDVVVGAPMSATISYGSNGFAPGEVTIKKGGTVTWTNNGGGNMWVASAQHPTHTTYSGTTLQQHCGDTTDTSFDQCKNSNSYSFTFTKTGTWAYHNHSNASQFGRVIVVE